MGAAHSRFGGLAPGERIQPVSGLGGNVFDPPPPHHFLFSDRSSPTHRALPGDRSCSAIAQ